MEKAAVISVLSNLVGPFGAIQDFPETHTIKSGHGAFFAGFHSRIIRRHQTLRRLDEQTGLLRPRLTLQSAQKALPPLIVAAATTASLFKGAQPLAA